MEHDNQPQIDPEQLQERFNRLSSILGDIVSKADEQAAERCPYRDRHDLCTAKFRCRNQSELDRNQVELDRNQTKADRNPVESDQATAALSCTHDGRFDYRSAWESSPLAVEKARDKVRKTRGSERGRDR